VLSPDRSWGGTVGMGREATGVTEVVVQADAGAAGRL